MRRNPIVLTMTRANHKDIEEARSQFPALLAAAEKGRVTIITRRGRSVAAIVPVAHVGGVRRQKSLLALAGSGKGLWGVHSTKGLRRLRGGRS
jgi:prevent-host-death family protein